MEYKVLKTFKGSPDGYTVKEYEEGTTVELPEELASVAIQEKWVQKPEGKPTPSAEKKVALEKAGKELGALKKAHKDASDADKPTLQAQIDAKQAELEVLKKQ
jgi:hypothetical protein